MMLPIILPAIALLPASAVSLVSLCLQARPLCNNNTAAAKFLSLFSLGKKNAMRTYPVLLLLLMILFACSTKKSEPDAAAEWVQLFNNTDLTGWDIKIAGHPLNDNFNNTFRVADSILKVDYSGSDTFTTEFGHIYYKEPFSYYKLRITYRFYGKQLAGGPGYAYLNSGVMLHSQSAASLGLAQSFPVSLEMQFLGTDSSIQQTTGNLCTPGTQVSMFGKLVEDHCINSISKYYDTTQWVIAEAVVLGDSVIHQIINGDTVLTYEDPVTGGGFVSNDFNWSTGGFGTDSIAWIQKSGMKLGTGYIALQAESHPVEFRKVELLNLEGCMDKNARNYKPYFIKADNTKCKY